MKYSILIVASLILAGCSNSSTKTNEGQDNVALESDTVEESSGEVVTSMMDGTESPVTEAKWTVEDISGTPSIMAKFPHPRHGVLELAYNPKMGFRFGWFGPDGKQKEMLPGDSWGGMGHSVIVTQEMVDKGVPADMLGEESMAPLQGAKKENGYLYFNSPETVKEFSSRLDDGSVTWLQFSQFISNGNESSASDPGGEMEHYLWGTRFNPGEFSKAKSQL